MDRFLLTSIHSDWLLTCWLQSSSRFWAGYFFKLVPIFCSLKAIVLNKYYYCWYWRVHNFINYSDLNWVSQSYIDNWELMYFIRVIHSWSRVLDSFYVDVTQYHTRRCLVPVNFEKSWSLKISFNNENLC